MGIAGFLEYIQRSCPQACVGVDLGQLARKRLENTGRGRGKVLVGQDPLVLLVDANSCLHRLYGGSFTDWVCGGQWNSMFHFIDNLARSSRSNNIKLVVFFNGSLEKSRTQQWFQQQEMDKNTAYQVLSHVYHRCSSPGKALWYPPVGLDSCIRLALRQCGITCIGTTHDHSREIMAFFYQTGGHGVMTQSAEFAFFNPPQLFSSHRFKLSMRGELSSQQFHLEEFAKMLDLPLDRFVVMGALLGNHILTDDDLSQFHWSLLGSDHPLNEMKDRAPHGALPPMDVIFKALVDYVRNIPSIYDLDAIAGDIFRNSSSRFENKVHRFKASVEYYYSSTKDAWTRHRGKGPRYNFSTNKKHTTKGSKQHKQKQAANDVQNTTGPDGDRAVDDMLDKAMTGLSLDENQAGSSGDNDGPSNSGPTSTNSDQAQSDRQSIPSLMEQPTPPCLVVKAPPLPFIPREVMRTALYRHENGLMMSYIYQILTQGEIKLNAGLDDEMSGEFPPSAFLFRPIRKKVYGILFSCQHLPPPKPKNNGQGDSNQNLEPQIVIKEWWLRQNGAPQKPDLVEAEPLDWVVPPIQRLWLGREPEDKTTRLRAFLSCLGSDSPSMLKPSYVPRHALVMCCVLRYMYQLRPPVLFKHELEAFLAQSVSQILNDTRALHELQVASITTRGVQLAALFMRGVEMALLVNDATGSPIPWELCCPWLFFDGKLFQHKLQKALMGSRMRELCDNKPDLTGKAERMLQCITEGATFKFASPNFAHMMGPPLYPPGADFYYNAIPAGAPMPPPPGVRDRNMFVKKQVQGPGGQLEVAGMVVGEWAGSDGRRPKSGYSNQQGGLLPHGRPDGMGIRPGMGRGGTMAYDPMSFQFPAQFYQQGPGMPPMWGYQPAMPPMLGLSHAPQQRRYFKQKQNKKRNNSNNKPGTTNAANKTNSVPKVKGRGRGVTIQADSPEKRVGKAAEEDETEDSNENISGNNVYQMSSDSDSSSGDDQMTPMYSGGDSMPAPIESNFPVGEFRVSPSDMDDSTEPQEPSPYQGGYDLPSFQANAQFNGDNANFSLELNANEPMPAMNLEQLE
ncbi:Constitutive coactivator of PPAR-gamma-like protein 1-like [Holothuria leucospilota]|uniref:Constitutive coactivator of PPAR-gamma-like protein 1-like n=1 Tax=Holothuria leucospilota TaxID=206669 RepID=A0A9Q1CLS3_HOLLE|nr:Constitutive coactivator of PPAR-gamma-like protein 1-like [Holothuria leucospilota]